MNKNRNKPSCGLTLIELVIALLLSALVVAALISMVTPVLRTQIKLNRYNMTRADALIALMSLRRNVDQASEIYLPGLPAGASAAASDVLSGCSNYSALKGAGVAGLIDPDQGNQSFYYCVANESIYYYSFAGTNIAPTPCPMIAPVTCGTGNPEVLANRVFPDGANAYFTRELGFSNLIKVRYKTVIDDVEKIVVTSMIFQSAAW